MIALYYSPWPADGPKRPPISRPFAQYLYAVWYKANPRDAGYMRALQQERLPAAEWVEVSADGDWITRVSSADKIVLLYPDAIGLGFGAVERTVFAHKTASAAVEVLNGRRRYFNLNGATRAALRVRRALERSMMLEFLFLPIFIVGTPILWTIDAVRGRA